VVGLRGVREDAFDRDGALGIPAGGSSQERGAAGAALVAEQFGVGEAGVIVDREVQVAPAGSTIVFAAVVVDALADTPETTELLDVDMQGLAWALSLVAWRTTRSGPGSRERPARRKTVPIVEAGRSRITASICGPARSSSRNAMICASASLLAGAAGGSGSSGDL
jgi:hypothetical protein